MNKRKNNNSPLKIAVLGHKTIPSRQGGIEIVVEELTVRMAKLGHKITVYNRSGHHVSGKEFDGKKLKEYKGIRMKYVPTIDKKGLAAIFTLLVSFVSGLCCACFMTLYQPFMTIWMGKNMLLSQLVVVLLCFYFWFYELVMMISVYKDAGGIWHEDRFRPLIAGVTNLIINLLLVNFMGLYGIILSTIASQLFISLPWIVKNVTALIFNRNPREYFKIIIINTLKVLFSTTVVYVIVSFIHIENVYGLILKGISTVFLAVFILMICFRRDEQYNNAKELLFKLLKLDKVLKKR